MYDVLDPGATDRALQHRIDNPPTPRAPKVSIWGQAGELIASPFKGVGQAVQETTRVANTVAPVSVGNPLAMTATEQEEILGDGGITRQAMDQDLRRGIQALRPDPVTSTVASQVVQGAARVLTKAAGYGLMAGPVGAVVGTGVDEGVTGAKEALDRGVDAETAAKVGAVRGVTMGASIALPVVGQTVARTVGLVAVGGPGAFVAEQALTRSILERANYADLAREYDPWDPVGLGLSVAIPGAVGVAVHRARAGKGAENTRALDEIAQDPEVVDAALVVHRTQTVNERALGDMLEPEIASSHTKALDEAARALDEGLPVQGLDVRVDPVRAAEAIGDMETRLRAVLDEARQEAPATKPELRLRDEDWEMPGGMDISQVMENARNLLGVGRTAQEAIDDLLAQGGPVSDLMANAMAAVEVFPRRIPELIEQYRAIESNRAGSARPIDMLDEAFNRMNAGKLIEPASRPLSRARRLLNDNPRLMARLDEGDQLWAAESLIDNARHQAKQDQADARAFEAAVECFLRTGS